MNLYYCLGLHHTRVFLILIQCACLLLIGCERKHPSSSWGGSTSSQDSKAIELASQWVSDHEAREQLVACAVLAKNGNILSPDQIKFIRSGGAHWEGKAYRGVFFVANPTPEIKCQLRVDVVVVGSKYVQEVKLTQVKVDGKELLLKDSGTRGMMLGAPITLYKERMYHDKLEKNYFQPLAMAIQNGDAKSAASIASDLVEELLK